MESNTITLVQESFEKVKPIAPVAAEIFYSKLFELDPQLKPLFPSGEDAMKTQGNKLMTMLGAAVVGTELLAAVVGTALRGAELPEQLERAWFVRCGAVTAPLSEA